MPYLILSDLHANREALDAVLEDARAAHPDGYRASLCLGDLVGYGADPGYAIAWAQTEAKVVIRGNHDKVCSGMDSLELYNAGAQASAVWNEPALDAAQLEYLRSLGRGPSTWTGSIWCMVRRGMKMSIWCTRRRPMKCATTWIGTLTFFGHTHVQGGFLVSHGGTRQIPPNTTLELEPDHFYLINPGSVGQPRDRDPRAAYLIYHPEKHVVEFRRVAYDIERAGQKILDAGVAVVAGGAAA